MSKTFRPWDVEQRWLLPPSVRELVPPDHVSHFVRDLVRDSLDLSAILGEYSEERGFPPYHPTMMTAVLLYSYTQGLFSSRKMAKACHERVDFMAVTALQKPDFRTLNRFRGRHLEALAGLFVQVLELCQSAGLVTLGHVAIDGTKIKANASKHKAMSYDRMVKSEPELRAEVERWFAQAEAEDDAEDEMYGTDRTGDELPAWVTNKEQRLKKIAEAKAALEAEAKAEAEEREAENQRTEEARKQGKKPKPRAKRWKHNADGKPSGKSQRNFTDADSRIMKTKDGYMQAYNAQAVVDATAQVIVAHALNNQQNDVEMLVPMVAQIKANTGRQAKELSADYGYLSDGNLKELNRRHIRGYVATGRLKHGTPAPNGRLGHVHGSRIHQMRLRIARGGHRSRYRLRKHVVEPVFGQIKSAMGFATLLLRGLGKVPFEWALVCTAHNIRKLAAAR